ncbi:hypothetical protein ACH47C_33575 [Streptomyces rishiriensis]|uniref:hypothetical protein n=1 Tax=Streptomyces rishiriensis TaxID=68264 RepID=UPI0033C3164A
MDVDVDALFGVTSPPRSFMTVAETEAQVKAVIGTVTRRGHTPGIPHTSDNHGAWPLPGVRRRHTGVAPAVLGSRGAMPRLVGRVRLLDHPREA